MYHHSIQRTALLNQGFHQHAHQLHHLGPDVSTRILQQPGTVPIQDTLAAPRNTSPGRPLTHTTSATHNSLTTYINITVEGMTPSERLRRHRAENELALFASDDPHGQWTAELSSLRSVTEPPPRYDLSSIHQRNDGPLPPSPNHLGQVLRLIYRIPLYAERHVLRNIFTRWTGASNLHPGIIHDLSAIRVDRMGPLPSGTGPTSPLQGIEGDATLMTPGEISQELQNRHLQSSRPQQHWCQESSYGLLLQRGQLLNRHRSTWERLLTVLSLHIDAIVHMTTQRLLPNHWISLESSTRCLASADCPAASQLRHAERLEGSAGVTHDGNDQCSVGPH